MPRRCWYDRLAVPPMTPSLRARLESTSALQPIPLPRVVFWALACIAATASFDFRGTPNPASRALPIVSLLHEGRYEITTFQQWTTDKARVGDRYFSDKGTGFDLVGTALDVWVAFNREHPFNT